MSSYIQLLSYYMQLMSVDIDLMTIYKYLKPTTINLSLLTGLTSLLHDF